MPNIPIARKVVKECLQVKEDEQVLIQTWDHTLDLSDSLSQEVYEVGAIPFVNLTTQNSFLNYFTLFPKNTTGRPREPCSHYSIRLTRRSSCSVPKTRRF